MQAAQGARPMAQPVAQPRGARNIVIDAGAVPAHGKGDRVFHRKFGYGTVMDIDGDRLDIEFDAAGAKMVVAQFVVAAARADDVSS